MPSPPTLMRREDITQKQIIEAFYVACGVGMVIADRACIAGATAQQGAQNGGAGQHQENGRVVFELKSFFFQLG